jgi:hypothetical protein
VSELPVARTVFALIVAAWVTLAPAYRQVLGHKSYWVRPWVMFSGSNLDVCRVSFTKREADGALTPIDRYEVMGHADWRETPRSFRKLADEKVALAQGRQLCRKLGGAEVFADVACATRKGWEQRVEPTTNVCERAPRPLDLREDAFPPVASERE